MNYKLKFNVLKRKIERKISDFWYWLMKPIAYFYTREKMNRRYQKKKDSISIERAIKYVAEDIALYTTKISKGNYISLIIADNYNRDYYSYEGLKYLESYILKRKKAKISYHKLTMDIDTQEKIIEELKKIKGLRIVEEHENLIEHYVKNYKKTYHIEYLW